jgi:hypothetical protein
MYQVAALDGVSASFTTPHRGNHQPSGHLIPVERIWAALVSVPVAHQSQNFHPRR